MLLLLGRLVFSYILKYLFIYKVLIYLIFMARTRRSYLEGLIKKKPESRVLNCITSSEARSYQILPVSISEFSEHLYVVARTVEILKDVRELGMETARETFGRIVVIEGSVKPERWDKAYEIFYGIPFVYWSKYGPPT